MASRLDKGHGRLEKRTIRVTGTLTEHQDGEGLRQGFAWKRERTAKGQAAVEVVHGITRPGPERADAPRLLELARGPWGIENGLPYRRDVTPGEEASRSRQGGAPQVRAALRNGVIPVRSGVAAPSLAAAVRSLCNCFGRALDLLGLPQLE